jgi:Flp pilus assembly protein TadG
MILHDKFFSTRDNEKGAVIVLIAILMIFFIGIVALAVDVYHLYVVRNELQNAADGGSLAGARELYIVDGTAVNHNANAIAANTAVQNASERIPVEVNYNAGTNSGDVERGHWSFATRTFTPNDSLSTIDMGNYTEAELDANLDYINAVKVITRRQGTPAASFFAQIFGYKDFAVGAEAVAYLGFAGSLLPADLDQPIAICEESILNDEGNYDCNMGRMLNSGKDPDTGNTGGWTNFSQPCVTASKPEMDALICTEGNPDQVNYGEGMGAMGGVQDVTFRNFEECWDRETDKKHFWNMTLPVIQCPSNNVSNCATMVGAVNVNVVWVQRDLDTGYDTVPREMENWSCEEGTPGFDCWKSFVDHFNLANVTGPPTSDQDYMDMWQKKAIYFLPSCEKMNPSGVTGGKNYGVLAQIPVLVD